MIKSIKIVRYVLLVVALGFFCNTSFAQNNQGQSAALIQEVTYKAETFMVVQVDTKTFNLELHNTGSKPLDFQGHADKKLTEGEAVLFAISAAPVKSAGVPYGLILKDGEVRSNGGVGFPSGDLTLEDLKGIFAYRKDGRTNIAASKVYQAANPTISDFLYAIESSPMLIEAGKLNEPLAAVTKKSRLSIITINAAGQVTFVISKAKVTYGFMAEFIDKQLGAKDALVLRTDDTSFYSPDTGVVNESGNALGPIFIVSHTMENSGASIQTDRDKKVTDELTDVIFQGKGYMVCKVNTKDYDIRLFNKTKDGRGVYTFASIDAELQGAKQNHIFSMNAGMFNRQSLPIGLLMVDGEEQAKINVRQASPADRGNFYDLPPNGVFSIDKKGEARVLTTDDYLKNYEPKHEIAWATQSGPMVVTKGKFNEAFNKGSTNLNIRNGVGINSKGEVLLVISLEPVNFYEFSELFKEHLDCENALYLDGAISQWFAPNVNTRLNARVQLGPLLTVIKK